MALSHKNLTSWYLQLAQAQEAGLNFAQSLRTSSGPPASDLDAMATRIETGCSIDDLLRDAPRWLPKADRYFISAAATTGKLPQTLHNLSEQHATMGANLQKMVLGLLYPIGVLNFACVLLPVGRTVSFEGGFSLDLASYLNAILPPLASLWSILLLIYVLVKMESPLIPLIMRLLPGLRGYYRYTVLARFAYGLGTFLNAGILVDRSWAGAGLIAGDKTLQHAVNDIREVIAQGGSPSEQLIKYPIFPDDFRALYTTGERTGQLDKNLLQIGAAYQKKANNMMTFVALLYPSIVFLIVAAMMIYQIVMLYARYLDFVTSIAE